jgi:hypothetical protein
VKIGIITIHAADNYGALLQAYALQAFLKKAGNEVTLIDYRPEYMINGGGLRWLRSRRDIHTNAGILFIKLGILRGALLGKERRNAFNVFRERHLRTSPRVYKSLDELKEYLPHNDALICGSDQIWNPPARYGVDPAYYLDFGPAFTRRISYAASFGKTHVEKEYREPIGKLLRRLDAVSVREESGMPIVHELSGQQASWVPDPTILNDDYQTITSAPEFDNFVFSYSLRDHKTVDVVKNYVAKIFNVRAIAPYNPQYQWFSGGSRVNLGPSEWLGHIVRSCFVVTNSFHGTIFSILFQKPFITVALAGKKQAYNERSFCLLGRLGLAHRILKEGQGEKELRILIKTPIDWDTVHQRLKTWRDQGSVFLINALSNSKHK